MPSVPHPGVIHLGLDVHRDSISVAVLEPDRESGEVDRIFNDEYSVRGSSTASPTPGVSGRAMRRGRRATTCTAC